jgi:hypothetical protein
METLAVDGNASADHGHDDALGHELADEPQPAGAERCAYRHLAASRRPSRQQQVGEVNARDQQDEADGTEYHQQSWPDVAGDLGLQRAQEHPEARRGAVIVGEARRHAVDKGLQFGRGLRQCHARLEPCDDLQVMVAAIVRLGAIERQRRPQIRVAAKVESLRQDADDGVSLAVELNAFSDDVAVGSHLRFPEAVVDERDMIVAGLVVVSREDAALLRGHTQQGKQVCRCLAGGDAERFAACARQVCTASRGEGCHSVERAQFRPHVPPLRLRNPVLRDTLLAVLPPDLHQLLRLTIGQGTQQHGVDDREDRGVGANPQSKCQDGNQSESGRFGQHPHSVAQVLEQ